MSLIFGSPVMLWALASLGVLTAIYLLRQRSRRVVVSSLFLWGDDGRTSDRGRMIRRLKTPLLFFLAILALLLLSLAIGDPLIPLEQRKPLLVVLDDSYSMLAGSIGNINANSSASDDSPRGRAMSSLGRMLDQKGAEAQVIIAGRSPTLLSDKFTPEQLFRLDDKWRCLEPSADLFAAIGLARQVAPGHQIVVLTDQPPDVKDDAELHDIRWLALGEPLSNVAIVGAVRRDSISGGQALIEVANFDQQPATVTLSTRHGETLASSHETIGADAIRRFTIPLPPDAGPLEVTLPDDSLSLDNRTVLLPDSPALLRVKLSIENEPLRQALRRAVEADGRAEITAINPHVRMTDTEAVSDAGSVMSRSACWDVYWVRGAKPESIRWPFILDTTHELLEGVSLTGVVLTRDTNALIPGEPLVMTDAGPVMTWRETSRNHQLYVQFTPETSTLLESVDFPVLISNLLRWRDNALPERCRPNVRLGDTVQLVVDRRRESCRLESPAGILLLQDQDTVTRSLQIGDDQSVAFLCDTPGRYVLNLQGDQSMDEMPEGEASVSSATEEAEDVAPENDESSSTSENGSASLPDRRIEISANVLFRDESNIQQAVSGEWGNLIPPDESRQEYRTLAPLLLILALAVWLLHGLVARSKGAAS